MVTEKATKGRDNIMNELLNSFTIGASRGIVVWINIIAGVWFLFQFIIKKMGIVSFIIICMLIFVNIRRLLNEDD